MPFARIGQAMLLLAALAVPSAFASRIHRGPTSGHAKHHRSSARRMHGQRAIDSSRATQIQTALIGHKYLSGAPSGEWDAQTQVAMQKYQSDHGWQTKIMPDSRALISLGLGPDHPTDTAAVPSRTAPSTAAMEAQPTEPAANTLASVHSISQ